MFAVLEKGYISTVWHWFLHTPVYRMAALLLMLHCNMQADDRISYACPDAADQGI